MRDRSERRRAAQTLARRLVPEPGTYLAEMLLYSRVPYGPVKRGGCQWCSVVEIDMHPLRYENWVSAGRKTEQDDETIMMCKLIRLTKCEMQISKSKILKSPIIIFSLRTVKWNSSFSGERRGSRFSAWPRCWSRGET